MAIQWHPLFAFLLRQLVEDYFEVLTNLPVGDLPREADIVLVRRTAKSSPFQGLWKHLTDWNVIEYKGPTVRARLEHLDLLVELGLGIHRRLNEEGTKNRKTHVASERVALWYVVSQLSPRFLMRASHKLGPIEPLGGGVWRASVLNRKFLFVSAVDLPVEYDTMPLHVLGVDSVEKEIATSRLIVEQPLLWDIYSQFMASLHESTLKELLKMARAANKGPKLRIKPLVDFMGIKEAIDQIGEKEVLDHFASDPKRMKKAMTFFLSRLTESERAELMRKLQ